MVDDDDQAGALVSYAESSGDSSEEETSTARHLWETFLRERKLQRTETCGNVPPTGSPSSNGEHQKSTDLGEERDKASRGETRQDFSVSTYSNQNVAVSNGTVDGSVGDGSLVVGSTDEVLPGQGVAGQVNVSESAQVLPGQGVAGQETVLEGAGQISGEETGQQDGEGGSNGLHEDGMKKSAVCMVQKSHEQLLTKGLLMRIYWKAAEGRIPVGQKDCPKGSNKMDRNLVISVSSDGASEQELSLEMMDNAGSSMGDGAVLQVYDPRTLIQSPMTEWVVRRGVADRAIWTAIAASARKICAEMIQIDELNGQLNTGRLLNQRREQGHYGDLHHPFHDNPCLPAVGNYSLSVMGVLLSPGIENEFRNTEKFGSAMEAIAYDWSRIPGMEEHVELMARVAELVHPFLVTGGQGTVVNSEFHAARKGSAYGVPSSGYVCR